MPDTLDIPDTTTVSITPAIPTGAGHGMFIEEYSTSDDCDYEADASEEWSRSIASSIAEWIDDPSSEEDEDDQIPSPNVLRTALRCAHAMQENGIAAPLRIVRTANGGVAFEWQSNSTFETLTVLDDGSIDWKLFHHGK